MPERHPTVFIRQGAVGARAFPWLRRPGGTRARSPPRTRRDLRLQVARPPRCWAADGGVAGGQAAGACPPEGRSGRADGVVSGGALRRGEVWEGPWTGAWVGRGPGDAGRSGTAIWRQGARLSRLTSGLTVPTLPAAGSFCGPRPSTARPRGVVRNGCPQTIPRDRRPSPVPCWQARRTEPALVSFVNLPELGARSLRGAMPPVAPRAHGRHGRKQAGVYAGSTVSSWLHRARRSVRARRWRFVHDDHRQGGRLHRLPGGWGGDADIIAAMNLTIKKSLCRYLGGLFGAEGATLSGRVNRTGRRRDLGRAARRWQPCGRGHRIAAPGPVGAGRSA